MKAVLRGIFLGIFATGMIQVHAQSTYRNINWGYEEGLPTQSNYNEILQSNDGYMWFASGAGAVRFDGLNFRLFTTENSALSANAMTTIFEDSNSRLWFGVEGDGFGVMFEDTTLFFRSPGFVSRYEETPDGILWIGTDGSGLWRMNLQEDNPSPERVFANELGLTIYDLHTSADGSLHVAAQNGVFTIADEDILHHSSTAGMPVTSVLADPSETIWYGTSEGLFRISGERSEPISFPDSAADRRVTNLISHPAAGFLVLANLTLYRLQDETLVPILESGNRILNTMTTDHEGGIWIGTEMHGLFQLVPTEIRSLTADDGLPGDIATVMIQAEDGTIHVGTTEGLAELKSGSTRIETRFRGSIVTSLLEDHQNRIWVALREEGVWLRDGENSVLFTTQDGLPSNTVWTLYRDHQNRILAGTNNGIALYTDEAGWKVSGFSESLLNGDVRVILETRSGKLWVGTSWGLHAFGNDTLKAYTTDDGLNSATVLDLAESEDGTVWIATIDGLHRYKDGVISAVTGGLTESELSRIIPVGPDLWIAGAGSVTVTNWEALNRWLDNEGPRPEILRYDPDSGLPGEVVGTIQPSGWQMQNGEFWFPTSRGAAIFDPGNRHRKLPPPPVIINYSLSGRDTLQNPAEISLPHNRDRLEISYTAFSYSNPRAVSYAYRLADFDSEWNSVGSRRTAVYTNIPPGEYRFEVKARIGDGAFSPQAASVPVTIVPAFYETFWFRISLAAAVLLMLWGIYTWRINALKKMEQLRVRIANDLHDEIGSNLGSIALRSRMLSRRIISDEEQNNLMEIDRISRQTAVAMRDIIWLINPGKDQVEDLQFKLKQVASQLLVDTPYEFRAGTRDHQQVIPLQIRRNTVFIFKEILHNIIKHSGASTVEISLLHHTKKMVLSVNDNGIGFDPATTNGDGIGLQSIRRRSDEMGASLQIQSTPGGGTRFEVTIPIT